MWKEIVLEWLDRNERSQAYLARKAKVNIFHLNGCLRGKREWRRKDVTEAGNGDGPGARHAHGPQKRESNPNLHNHSERS